METSDGDILLDRGADGLHRRAGEGCDREGDVILVGAAKQLVQFIAVELRLVPIADALGAAVRVCRAEKPASFSTK